MRYLAHGEHIRHQIADELRREHRLRPGSDSSADLWTALIALEISHDRHEARQLLSKLGVEVTERTVADPGGVHRVRTLWDLSAGHPDDPAGVRIIGRHINTIDMMAHSERWRAIAAGTAVVLPVEFSQRTLADIHDRLNAHLAVRRRLDRLPSIDR